jgi:O-succinylbenzoate synthase
VKLTAVELRRISLPLVAPFRTSFGTEVTKQALLVRVITPESEGWGECVAMDAPLYSYEYVDIAQDVLSRFMLPKLFSHGDVTAGHVAPYLAPFKGHPMAKAAIEMAVLDAELRQLGQPLATFFGATRDRVPSGVSVGIMESIPQLLDVVGGYLDEGYVRIKLKIEPGWDVEPVRAVRERFGDDLLLQVDANTAYTLGDARHLARLDAFDLLLIEQPLPEDDVRGHAELARRIQTPVCLDESVTSARAAADAIALGACQIINVKPGRVGGYLEARRIAAVAAANGVPVWCGGMLESGIGRAHNVALASLPNFSLPGDLSPSSRYWARDIVSPEWTMDADGLVRVPTERPGLGVDVDEEMIERLTVRSDVLTGNRPTVAV